MIFRILCKPIKNRAITSRRAGGLEKMEIELDLSKSKY